MVTVRTCVIVSGCMLIGSTHPEGQTQAERPQTPPVFRAETRAIEVDAFVTDAKGRFVSGLAREDFEIFEDGQPQEIATFTMVDVPLESAGSRERSAQPGVDSDVVTNVTPGRIYVMLLDAPGVRPSPTAAVKLSSMFRLTHLAASRFVEEALGPNDLMAVVHVQDWRSDAQSFTSNKRLLVASIERLKADLDIDEGTSPPLPYCDERKLRNSYEALETISRRLAGMTGKRKSVLWFNGRVPLDPADPEECGKELGAAQVASLEFIRRDAMRAATRHNVVIYPIDPVGLINDPPVWKGLAGPETPSRQMKRLAAQRAIAADTGGEAILNTNNFSGAFESLVRSNSTYYLLGYRPAQDHRDGRFHTITIRVRRPGLSVRARKGYLAPEPGPTVEARVLPGVSPAGGAALVNPFPTTGLEISVFLSPFKGAARDASVVLGADLRGLVRDGAEGRLEVSFLAIDAQGAMRVGSPKNLALSDLGSQSAGPARYIDRLALPPGRHEVRIAMHQPGGETGSVTTYVEVPDFTQGPLGMSGLVLASAGTAAQPTLLADATLKDRLSSDPTVRRRFARSDSITAFGEVYVDERTRPEDVRVTATIATAGQKSVRSVTPAVAANEPGRVGHTTRLALAGLTPGDYVLTLEAQVGRRRAMRQVPFSVLSD